MSRALVAKLNKEMLCKEKVGWGVRPMEDFKVQGRVVTRVEHWSSVEAKFKDLYCVKTPKRNYWFSGVSKVYSSLAVPGVLHRQDTQLQADLKFLTKSEGWYGKEEDYHYYDYAPYLMTKSQKTRLALLLFKYPEAEVTLDYKPIN